MEEYTDYKLTYSRNIQAGTKAVIKVIGKGNWKGSRVIQFSIDKVALTDTNVNVKIADVIYNGKEQKPKVTLDYVDGNGNTRRLKKGTDYQIQYYDNVGDPLATTMGYLTITGVGNYENTIGLDAEHKLTFRIATKTSASKFRVTGVSSCTYDGNAHIFDGKNGHGELQVKIGSKVLTKGVDYNVTYANNINAGTGLITINGMGAYVGEKLITFRINPLDLQELYRNQSLKYLGDYYEISFPYVGNRLLIDHDYYGPLLAYKSFELLPQEGYQVSGTISSKSGIRTGNLVFKGIGNYKGKVSYPCSVKKADFYKYSSKISYKQSGDFLYTGSEIKPQFDLT
ncbi:MAG: hypothetical protein GX567_14560, partial [Clostridia bacterium]|nr:hypothetical protein [Clostridia bacterium]